MMTKKGYRVLRAIVKPVFSLLFPLRVQGEDNVPREGAVLLCANHQSLTDPIALCCVLERQVRFMAKKELFSVPGLKQLLRALGAFPVDRGAGDLAAIRGAMNILKEESALGIFPQGTRTWKEKKAFQSGAALLALKSKAAVVPVYIHARARLFRPIHMVFGQPVPLEEYQGSMNSRTLEKLTADLEKRVYMLEDRIKC